jgi:hypothetical protein
VIQVISDGAFRARAGAAPLKLHGVDHGVEMDHLASRQVGGGRYGGPLAAIKGGDGLVPPSAKKIAAACILVQFRQKLRVCKLHGAAGLRKALQKRGGFDSLHPLQHNSVP